MLKSNLMPFPDPVGNNLANAPLSRPEVSKFAFFSTKVHQATQPGSRFQLFWHFRHLYEIFCQSPSVCLVKGWKCWYQNLSEAQFIPKFIPCPYITRNLRLFTDEINYRIVGVITAGSQPGNKSKFMENMSCTCCKKKEGA